MPEELGKIERLPVDTFKKGRRLYFVPLIYSSPRASSEFIVIYSRYWNQVESQVSELELKLGKVSRVYHELIPFGGEDGAKAIEELSERSYKIIKDRIAKGASLEATEEAEILSEFMDWSKCLMVGLQNQKVFTKLYEFYTVASNKRNEYIAKHLADSLGAEEIGLLFMREGHQIQFPADIEIFYVAPPALDEIKRWLRDQESKAPTEGSKAEEGR
ncbi:MAG: hypothetical protein V1767_09455 [Chloroflexota bacterium]